MWVSYGHARVDITVLSLETGSAKVQLFKIQIVFHIYYMTCSPKVLRL